MLTCTIDFAEVCRWKRNSDDRRKTDRVERHSRKRTNVLLGRNIQDVCKKTCTSRVDCLFALQSTACGCGHGRSIIPRRNRYRITKSGTNGVWRSSRNTDARYRRKSGMEGDRRPPNVSCAALEAALVNIGTVYSPDVD